MSLRDVLFGVRLASYESVPGTRQPTKPSALR